MGVMLCSRARCTDILCDHRVAVHEQGTWTKVYLCNTCFGELLDQKKTWPRNLGQTEVLDLITAFVDKEIRSNDYHGPDTTDEWFRRLTE